MIEIGPLTLRAYGIMLLIGILVAVYIAGKLWVSQGGDWDLVYRCSMWGVLAGIIGARAYHVITSWNEVPDEWWGVFAVWKGGLGVWGGVAAGVITGAIIAKRSGANVPLLADCVAPGILLAQGIGRFGNYFNQELFGTPTTLPWALEIDPEHRPAGYAQFETFQPTFLYEFLWDAAGAAIGIWLVARPQAEARRGVLPLRHVVLARALLLGGAVAGRSLARGVRNAPQFLDRARLLPRRRRRLRLVAAAPRGDVGQAGVRAAG